MKNGKIVAIVALVVALAAGVYFFRTGSNPSTSAVRIAVNIPLSGPMASFSGDYGNALTMGIDDACKEMKVSRSSFAVDMQDNQGLPADAATIAQKQAISGFDVYISGLSQMSTAVAPVVDATPALHFLVSYNAHLTEKNPNRMRILTHYKAEGPVYVQYARMRQAKRVMAFTLNNPEIEGEYAEYVEPGLKSLGVSFDREVFEFDGTDYRTLALKAKKYKPDLIFVNGFSIHMIAIARALRAERMIADGNVLATMGWDELLGAGTPIQDLVAVAYIVPPIMFPENRAARDAWNSQFRQRFGRTPGDFAPAFAYDTGRLIVQARAKAGKVTKETVRAQLPFNGISGVITVDGAGDLSTPLGVLKVGADGGIERVL